MEGGEEMENPFEKVLDRLRKYGHCKHAWGTERGPNCLNGAADYAGIGDVNFQEITSTIALEQFPDRVKEEGGNDIPFWMAGMCFNNHPDTTFSDVERVLEKAAVKWEEKRVAR